MNSFSSPARSRFRPFTLLGCAVVLMMGSLGGCSSDDAAAESSSGGAAKVVCGDGRAEASEVCDGGDVGAALCTDAGFDGGAVLCSSDCGAVDFSTCEYYDVDGDGLTTDLEVAAGTDPALADTDTDGFTDGEEVEAGSDPLSIDSWPMASQRWPNRFAALSADGVVGEGWDPGDIAKNLKLIDQYGNPLELHQLYGYNVVLSVGARWCGPCNDAASSSQDLWMEYADQGVIFVEMLLDGNTPGKNATQNDIDYWANKYDIEFPVTWRDGSSSLAFAISALPTFLFIGRDLKISKWIEGFPGDSGIAAEIKKFD